MFGRQISNFLIKEVGNQHDINFTITKQAILICKEKGEHIILKLDIKILIQGDDEL